MPLKSKAQKLIKEYGKGYMHGAGAGAVSGGLVGSAVMARAMKKKHEKKATFEAALSVVTDKVDVDGNAFKTGFVDGMKTSSTAGELAGLGVLAVPAAIDIAHRPKKETPGEAKMRKIRAGAELTGLGILAGSAIRSATKAAADIHGQRGDTRSNEEFLRSSPLGERILADYNARCEHLQAAVDSWRRMRDSGTSRADKITV